MRARLLVLLIALATGACEDEKSKTIQACRTATDSDARFAACTEAIETGGLSRDDAYAAHLFRGAFLLSKSDTEPAIEALDQALSLTPKGVQALKQRGTAYSNLGDFEKAVADYAQLVKLGPSAERYANLGRSQHHLERFSLAEVNLQESIRLNPENAKTHFWLGETLLATERFAEAEEWFTRAIELAPDAVIYGARGNARIGLGRMDEAMADVLEAVELDETSTVTYWQEFMREKGFYGGEIDGADSPEFRSTLGACFKNPDCLPQGPLVD